MRPEPVRQPAGVCRGGCPGRRAHRPAGDPGYGRCSWQSQEWAGAAFQNDLGRSAPEAIRGQCHRAAANRSAASRNGVRLGKLGPNAGCWLPPPRNPARHVGGSRVRTGDARVDHPQQAGVERQVCTWRVPQEVRHDMTPFATVLGNPLFLVASANLIKSWLTEERCSLRPLSHAGEARIFIQLRSPTVDVR